MLKTTGTKMSGDDREHEPADRAPERAFCSPPSPRPSAMGAMPMTIASGHRYRAEAHGPRRRGGRGPWSCRGAARAKLITRLLAV
jgi:hypothetical protein